ncbi:MAG: GNAT family N-acetyltransferase [Thermoplasmatota archaeon]
MPARSVGVRRAKVSDLSLLVAHRRAMWADMGRTYSAAQLRAGDRRYRRWLATRLRSGRLVAFVAEDRNRAVGSGCVWLQEVQPNPGYLLPTRPYVLSMYTVPEARGRGHASRIIRAARDWARREGFPIIALHASKQGRPVYKRLGFDRTWEMRLHMTPQKAGLRAPRKASATGRSARPCRNSGARRRSRRHPRRFGRGGG